MTRSNPCQIRPKGFPVNLGIEFHQRVTHRRQLGGACLKYQKTGVRKWYALYLSTHRISAIIPPDDLAGKRIAEVAERLDRQFRAGFLFDFCPQPR